MKKRILAMLLSASICFSGAMEIGATAFSAQSAAGLFGDGSGEVVTEAIQPSETPEEPEVPETETEIQNPEKTEGENQEQSDNGISGENPMQPEIEIGGENSVEPGTGEDTENAENGEQPGENEDSEVFQPEGDVEADVENPEGSEEDSEIEVFQSEEAELEIEVFTSEEGEGRLLEQDGYAQVRMDQWEREGGLSGVKWRLKKGNGTDYFTFADGLICIETFEAVGSGFKSMGKASYFFDEYGYLVTGHRVIKAGTKGFSYTGTEEVFFSDAERAVLNAGITGSVERTPYNSDLGVMKKKYWLWDSGVFRYYDAAGRFLSVAELRTINLNNNKYTGYYKINGGIYCLDANGKPKTGEVKITEGNAQGTYYFSPKAGTNGIPGNMVKSKWIGTESNNRWSYYSANGKLYKHGIIVRKLDTSIMGSSYYLLDKNGYLLKSKMAKAETGYYYASDSKGRIYKEKMVKVNGARYYFTSSGKRATWKNTWKRCAGQENRYYYFGSTAGKVVEKKGWHRISGTKDAGWYYFSNSGNHYINKLTSQGYYFGANGRMAEGMVQINGKMYFFQYSTKTEHKGAMFKGTMIRYKGNWYYAESNGVLVKSGWKMISGQEYYFENYITVRNAFVAKNGTYGYLDANGKFCTGWVIVNNSKNLVRYVDPQGSGFLKNTSRVIDGLRYYFDKDGYRINDLTHMYSGPYAVDVDRINGVMTVYNSSRTVPVKTIRVSVGLSSTPTPTGSYRLNRSLKWQPLMGPSWGQYGTHVVGAGQGGIFVHSIACSAANSYNLPAGEYNKLGNPASHGCIRCCVADAKWVYDNCNGASIRIFDGAYKADEVFKGPLGRRALTPLYGSMNFDPTDPAV